MPSTASNPSKKSMLEEKPVFAISTGRSGSTLVQRLLNCHPDLVLWGEHSGFLNGFSNLYREQKLFPKTADANKGPEKLLPTLQNPSLAIEWVNPWSLDEFSQQLRVFLQGYFAGRLEEGQRWGFKEIRYNSLPTLNMLRQVYPQGKFVFIRRSPIEVTRSKVFAFIKESNWEKFSEAEKDQRIRQMLREVQHHYHVYDNFMKKHSDCGIIVDYETLLESPTETINAVLTHLDFDLERFDWDLGNQVLGNIITKTSIDKKLLKRINGINEKMLNK